MNSVNLIGRTTKDVELKNLGDGKAVCSFCLAVDAGKDKAYFIDCVAWDAKAKQISETVKKGDKIGIAGVLTTRNWQDSNGNSRKATEVLVLAFDYCSSRSQPQEAPEEKKEEAPEAPEQPQASGELPFEI